MFGRAGDPAEVVTLRPFRSLDRTVCHCRSYVVLARQYRSKYAKRLTLWSCDLIYDLACVVLAQALTRGRDALVGSLLCSVAAYRKPTSRSYR